LKKRRFKKQFRRLIKQDNSDDYEEIRAFPLYVILCSGIIIILIGIYLLISHQTAEGITTRGRYAPGNGKPASLSGGGAICIGVIFALFPAFAFYFRKKRK